VVTWLALVGAVALLGHASYLIVTGGSAAFAIDGWARADFFITSSLPALGLAPLFVLAFHNGLRACHRTAGLFLAWGMLLFGLSVLIPGGVYAPGWYLLPVLVLLLTCTFGVFTGIAQASVVVFGLLACASVTPAINVVGVSGVWTHAAVAGIAVVAMALLGSLLQRTLTLAISAEEDQNERMDEARRALRHRENLLRHAMRIETVGEMASMVVHQLRNQFQLILGYAAVGIRSTDDRTAAHFRSIVDTLGQSNDLLEGLLGMSRTEAGVVERVDLTEHCRQVRESYRRVLPASVKLRLTVPDHPVPVSLNPEGLEHALLNLVINARQAIDGEGEIHLRLDSRDGVARLEVADTGSGIADDDLDEVFKPFFTTKKKGEGTGLGLAAVQRFVMSSGGEVSVASRVGIGTTFSLEFPVETEQRLSG
jgi:signal transduction histidine kinase